LALDIFETQSIDILSGLNNTVVNAILEEKLVATDKIGPDQDRESREKFIEAKYVQKLYVDKGGYGSQHYSDRLFQSASKGELAESLTCILKDADLNFLDEEGQSALSKAILNAHFDVAQLLVLSGADINQQETEGKTPIHFACMHAPEEFIIGLMSKGGNVLLHDDEGKTATDYAKERSLSESTLNQILSKS